MYRYKPPNIYKLYLADGFLFLSTVGKESSRRVDEDACKNPLSCGQSVKRKHRGANFKS